MFSWDEKSIKWFSQSANQTDFHKKIANEILKFVDNNSSLLSLGSGLGYLDRALAPSFNSMTLVDNDDFAIDFLEKNKLKNQKIIKSDWKELNIKSDYLLLSFFSRMYINDTLDDLLKLTNKKIFYLVNERHCDERDIIKYLCDKGVSFCFKHLRLNFDQYLKKSEIDDYINHYYSNASEKKINNLLNQIEEIDVDNVVFRNKKKLIFIIIDKGDLN